MSNSKKRVDYISWDEYFMGIALLSAQRSKDNNSQVGACIVSPDHKILSMGYNGMPIGCDDDEMPWDREGDTLNTKYVYVCHAELNAILNYGRRFPERGYPLRHPVPLQRMCQSHHPRAVSAGWSISAINMPTPNRSRPPRRCSIWWAWSMFPTSLPARR